MKFIYSSFLLLLIKTSLACDVCGCSLSGYNMGLFPDVNKSFVGFKFNQAKFTSTVWHSSNQGSTESNADSYYRSDFLVRFKLLDRVNIIAQLPYVYNRMVSDEMKTQNVGIGDPSLLVSYKLLGGDLLNGKQSLIFSGGIKFPLGKFNEQVGGVLINPNFQNGSGTFDAIVNANYSFRKKITGFNVESSYKINSTNKFDYRFGNQFNAAVNNFYFFEEKKLAHLYYFGLYYEMAARHQSQEKPVFNTGGIGLYGNFGLQVYVKKFRFGSRFQLPLVQKFHTDNLTEIIAKPRFELDCIFFFGGNTKKERNV